jgi:hypothetical protein
VLLRYSKNIEKTIISIKINLFQIIMKSFLVLDRNESKIYYKFSSNEVIKNFNNYLQE